MLQRMSLSSNHDAGQARPVEDAIHRPEPEAAPASPDMAVIGRATATGDNAVRSTMETPSTVAGRKPLVSRTLDFFQNPGSGVNALKMKVVRDVASMQIKNSKYFHKDQDVLGRVADYCGRKENENTYFNKVIKEEWDKIVNAAKGEVDRNRGYFEGREEKSFSDFRNMAIKNLKAYAKLSDKAKDETKIRRMLQDDGSGEEFPRNFTHKAVNGAIDHYRLRRYNPVGERSDRFSEALPARSGPASETAPVFAAGPSSRASSAVLPSADVRDERTGRSEKRDGLPSLLPAARNVTEAFEKLVEALNAPPASGPVPDHSPTEESAVGDARGPGR